jgi:sRNA-binding carbon storage regulator CsrA
MVTTLSVGDKIHAGDSVTLTLLDIEGDLIRFGVEAAESAGPVSSVLIELRNEADLDWLEWN